MEEKSNEFRLKRDPESAGEEPQLFRLVKLTGQEGSYQKPGFRPYTGDRGQAGSNPPQAASGQCCCDSVCACHSVGETTCTCNQVCSCNQVCTCDTECSCVSYVGCGSDSHYWYPN